MELIRGLLLPFLGTLGGAACVFLTRQELRPLIRRSLEGFAAGVMTAAAVWSLLLPALEQAAAMGRWLGIFFLLLLDRTVPHLHQDSGQPEGPRSRLERTTMLALAVTLHNIPEGLAVGVTLAGRMAGDGTVSAAGALALALGIALQNFPEGAVISLPLRASGMGRGRAFWYGVLSGAAEPLAAGAAFLAAGLTLPALPYLLGFAAGAMIYVVVEELIPEASAGEHSNLGTLLFALGFTLMLALDVVLE